MPDDPFKTFVGQQFPTLERMLYANHAAISPWPRAAADAASGFAGENAEQGPMGVSRWLLRESALRRDIARMLNAGSGDDIALLKNTSEGINVVANGIDWQAGDNLVTAEGEYVTNQMPWDALRSRGVAVRRVDIRAAADAESALLDAIDERSRVLAVSSVQWDDGFRLDLARLGHALDGSPVLFFVDAIQQFGALGIDVQACCIDALSAGSHKWQMGPEGMALFYTSPRTRERLGLAQHGWRMLDDPYRFERPDRAPSSTARRFESGSPNSLGQAALAGSLGVLLEEGMAEVERRILDNTATLLSGLAAIGGLRILSRTEAGRRSGIVSFVAGDLAPESIRARLSRRGVFVAVRNGVVRLSPHFYQHGAPLQRLLGEIESVLD